MAIAGNAPGVCMGLSLVTVGLIAVLSYLGPRGAGAMVERWASRKRRWEVPIADSHLDSDKRRAIRSAIATCPEALRPSIAPA